VVCYSLQHLYSPKFRYAKARKRLLSNRKTPFWMCYEAMQCAVMVAAMVMLMIYVYRMNISARLSSS
jgi:hypothetical protein